MRCWNVSYGQYVYVCMCMCMYVYVYKEGDSNLNCCVLPFLNAICIVFLSLSLSFSLFSLFLSLFSLFLSLSLRQSPKLNSCGRIRKLQLFNCFIKAEGCKHLSIALQTNSLLTSLQLDYNSIGMYMCVYAYVYVCVYAYVYIQLNTNIHIHKHTHTHTHTHTYIGTEGARAICEGIRKNNKMALKFLSLSYCDIGPKGGQPIGNLLRKSSCTIR